MLSGWAADNVSGVWCHGKIGEKIANVVFWDFDTESEKIAFFQTKYRVK